MATTDLTQAEADGLIAMQKVRVDEKVWDFPSMGGRIAVPLVSMDRREDFLLDVSRGRIDLVKTTYQNRARQVIVLVRLDCAGPPHRNPDGTEMLCPHLHLFREGYGVKWAFPVPPAHFEDINDQWRALSDFMRYCSIVQPPLIRRNLFT